MGWLSNLFNKSNSNGMPSPSTDYHDLDGLPVPVSAATVDLRAAREMVNAAALRTVQAYGVPAHWLSFEVVTISDAENAYFQLQVQMKHWDEYMAAHSFAFERAVMKRLREDDPEVGRALRAVLWHVAPDAGCPYDDMPEAKAWSADAIKKRGMVRDRINRDLYAVNTPASGAKVATMMPVSADDADRADRSTMPVKYESLLDDDGYNDTEPANLNGFAATQPFIHESAKKTK
jgi:hypothetical protein